MREYKVSVIIPIYNAGPHLKKCLDSLAAQTLKELQIVLVLQKPTDGSDAVVKSYQQDNFLIVENDTNTHLGEGRNKGLEYATGKYVGFCDHDDYCYPTMFEELYNACEKNNADMAISPFIAVDANGNIMSRFAIKDDELSCYENIFMATIGLCKEDSKEFRTLAIPKTVWNRLYKLDIIRDNKIRFIDTRTTAPEDTTFNIEYMIHAKSAAICSNDFYLHFYHDSNLGESMDYRSFDKYVVGFCYWEKLLTSHGLMENTILKKRFYNTIRANTLVITKINIRKKGILFTVKKLREIKKINLIRNAFKEDTHISYITGDSFKNDVLSKIIKYI